jgi:hypothetical protein
LLAGPILWSLHFIVGYLLVEAFCQAGWNFSVLGLNGISFIVSALTVLALIGTALFAFKSYRSWRAFNPGRNMKDELRDSSRWFEEPAEFMYFSGFLLSVLFAVVILMVGLPALFLHPC